MGMTATTIRNDTILLETYHDDETIVASVDTSDNNNDQLVPTTRPVEIVISFGIPSVPDTTIAALKGNEEEKEVDTASSINDHKSTSRSVSFNEEVTMNHVDNFRYVLKKRERYAIWYTEIEMNRMFIDGYDETNAKERKEKIQENKQIMLSNTTNTMVVDCVTTKKSSNTVSKSNTVSTTTKRGFSFKKAKSISNFLVRTNKQRNRVARAA